MNDVAARVAPAAPVEATPPTRDPSARRADVDAKQALVASLLRDTGREGLFVFEPENFAWLTAGAVAHGSLDPAMQPALYLNADQRWLLASNADSQRLFDEELDGLGFQLKEWPWYMSRASYVSSWAQGRSLACDRPVGDCKLVAEPIGRLRRALTAYEQACLRDLGLAVGHAIEATCRTMSVGQTELEVAGQLAHRLIHHGAEPVSLRVAADGRSALYRRGGSTDTPVRAWCVVAATARKHGLYATASRTVCFGTPDAPLLRTCNAACKVSAAYAATSVPRALSRDVLAAGRRVYQITGFEHEWRGAPQGHVTGRMPVELTLTAATLEMLQPDWALTWTAAAGPADSWDTFLVTEQGGELVTTSEFWPAKSIRVQGKDVERPFLLVR